MAEYFHNLYWAVNLPDPPGNFYFLSDVLQECQRFAACLGHQQLRTNEEFVGVDTVGAQVRLGLYERLLVSLILII